MSTHMRSLSKLGALLLALVACHERTVLQPDASGYRQQNPRAAFNA
ncbi:MAG: hypothetical protein L0271_09830 [Gemmatimonadetes bacterium]|nr:hypothetical protein [Gemmatimonadota bacterium]